MIIAIISGALMSIQGIFNTKVTDTTGVWTANAFVQFTALLVCLGAWATVERNSFATILQVQPKYMLLGGAMGAAITWTVIQSMKTLGPAQAVMFIVVAQIIVAYLIELFGLFGVLFAKSFYWLYFFFCFGVIFSYYSSFRSNGNVRKVSL